MSIDDLMALFGDYAASDGHPYQLATLRTAIESALAAEYERGRTEREQDAEPVAWCSESTLQLLAETGFCHAELTKHARSRKSPLYAAPPKPLTDERIASIAIASGLDPWGRNVHIDFARAIERGHGISDE